ncbi:general secretion pathway protein GspK [Candidatus Electronema sp. PJ]|uniref:general secretion pathway protein GspK n=1 Tax=Candidatus Electronema sp. PJ TaxID=3401572 RepID=UPI003AA89215
MLHDRKGMALVLTLLAVSFMVAVTVQLGSSVNWQMQAAATQSDIVQLDAMLLSGLHLAQAALLADQRENQYDSAFDRWGTFDVEVLAALFPGGKLDVQVTDLSGLLQINALVLTTEEKKQQEQQNKKNKNGTGQQQDEEKQQRELWQRFLKNTAGLEKEEDILSLLDSLVDWIDEDDEERENGAEKTYYSSQSPPYAPANRPVLLPEELFLIKGWDKLLRRESEDDDTEEAAKKAAAIIQYLSAAGEEGTINLNTAPVQVLQALHEQMTEELATKLVEFRQAEENKDKLEELDWYKQIPGFPGDIVFDNELVTVSSSWFKVTVDAEFKGLQRTGIGVIHRMDNQEQELLWWKAE